MAFWNRKKQVESWEPARFDGKRLRYVTERDSATAVESVIGRQGLLGISPGGEVAIVCDGTIVYRGMKDSTNVAELMSGEGAVVKGYDTDRQIERVVVAYYHYHRKV